MADDNEYKKKYPPGVEPEIDESGETGESGESGQGSIGGQIEFTDFLSVGDGKRDDLLTEEEKRRLLSVHGDLSEANIKKGKDKRDHYKSLKEGKITLAQHRQGMGSRFPSHPLLSNKAQFSGMDTQVNPSTDLNQANTNNAEQDRLENRLQNRLQNRLAPSSAPRLIPR